MLTEFTKDNLKKLVSQNFSKHAHHYDQEAFVQKVSAENLLNILDSLDIHVGELLEIGCGTGFVTQGLIKRFAERKIKITDLSAAMLEICRNKIEFQFQSRPYRNFSVLDGEHIQEKNYYPLIISGLTFQWFQHFEASIIKLVEALKPEGILLFSYLQDSSFPEWQAICREHHFPFTGYPLPSVYSLRDLSAKKSIFMNVIEESITVVYSDILHFFKSLKNIGAKTSLNENRMKTQDLKNLLRISRSQYAEGFPATYKIVYCSIKRLV